MGNPTISIGKNKDADQLRGNRKADPRLCFCYTDSTIPPLLNSKLSSFKPASVALVPDDVNIEFLQISNYFNN